MPSQDTLVRAWRNFDQFEGRSAVRSWLYRIATNVCLDMLGSRQRCARPMDLNPARTADAPLGVPLQETAWLEPIPDSQVLPAGGDPAELTVQRDSVRLAFVAVDALALCFGQDSRSVAGDGWARPWSPGATTRTEG